MTRRILISRFDWMQETGVTLSGGVWRLPLANLLDHRPQIVAEAWENRDWGSTTFDVDLGYPRKVSLFFFANLRTSFAAFLSLKAGLDPTFASNTYSLVTSAWPKDNTPSSTDAWGVYSFDGLMRDDEHEALGFNRVLIPSAEVTVRYIRAAIRDSCNPNPLRIGCFGAVKAWEPPINFAYDWSVTPMDEADIQHVPGGSTEITKRGIRRRLNLGFDAQPEDEIWSRGFGLALTASKSKPGVFVPFSDSTQVLRLEKTAVYGLVSADTQLSNPFFGRYKMAFQVDQLR